MVPELQPYQMNDLLFYFLHDKRARLKTNLRLEIQAHNRTGALATAFNLR